MTNTAERVSALFDDDGGLWELDDGRGLRIVWSEHVSPELGDLYELVAHDKETER